MRSSSAFLLSVLPFVSQVLCAPAAQGSRQLTARDGPAPGSVVKCPVPDSGCECTQNYDGSIEWLCGYVDSDWHNPNVTAPAAPKAKRDGADEVSPADESFDALTHAALDMPGFPSGLSRREDAAAAPDTSRQPQILFANDPVLDALRLLTPDALTGVGTVIRNKASWATRGRFVQGLAGAFENPINIARPFPTGATWETQPFPKGTAWLLRWDFAWYGANNTFPAIGMLGAHLRLEIHAPDNPANNISLAFYPPTDSDFAKAEQQGDYYFTNVLLALRDAAQWFPAQQKFRINQVFGARALADAWYKDFTKKGGVPLKPYTPAAAPATPKASFDKR